MAVAIPYVIAGIAAYSAYQQGQTAKATGKYNAEVARNQAEMNNSAATSNIEQQRSRARAVIGRQLAATSESGTGLSGSNLDLLNQSLHNNDLDSLNIRYQAQTASQGLNSQAAISEYQGGRAATAGYINAAASLAGGAAGSYTQQGSTMPSSAGSGGGYSSMNNSYSMRSSDMRFGGNG